MARLYTTAEPCNPAIGADRSLEGFRLLKLVQSFTDQEKIDQMAKALTYYREHPPSVSTRAETDKIARRFAVDPREFWRAIGMLRRVEDGELNLD